MQGHQQKGRQTNTSSNTRGGSSVKPRNKENKKNKKMATIVPDGGQNIVQIINEVEAKPVATNEVEAKPVAKGTPYQYRAVFNRSDKDVIKTLETQLQESEYTWVMENRMEFNRPLVVPQDESSTICHCRWRVVDNVSVVYFDDEMYDHVVAENPFYHENISFCCGSSGKTIKFRKRCHGCPSTKFCSTTVLDIKVTEGTADKCVVIIKEACEDAKAKMTP